MTTITVILLDLYISASHETILAVLVRVLKAVPLCLVFKSSISNVHTYIGTVGNDVREESVHPEHNLWTSAGSWLQYPGGLGVGWPAGGQLPTKTLP